MPPIIDYLQVALLGALVGAGELTSRYRDAPKSAIYTRPALFYIAMNAGASVFALSLIEAFGWTFGANPESARLTRVLTAGIGAMALFRASLFTVRAGDRDVAVGPAGFLQIFRDAADRAVDRMRAQDRGVRIAAMMQGIDYRKAADGLVPYCLALMQNVPEEEQQKLLRAIDLLDKDEVEDAIRVRILGLHLYNVVGASVLTAAVEALREQIKTV